MGKFFIIFIIQICLSLSADAQTVTLKQIRREAVKLEKEGWKAAVNKPDIQRQLRDAYLQSELMEDGVPRYIVGFSRRKGFDYQRVHSEAIASAKKDIINQMESYVLSEFNHVTTISGSKVRDNNNRINRTSSIQKLKKTVPTLDIFRELKDGEVEVEVRIFYDIFSNDKIQSTP